MDVEINQQANNFLESLERYREAVSFNREEKLNRLLSQVDLLCRTTAGIEKVYEQLPAMLNAQVLHGTVWERPGRLVPGLVPGTLLAGHPSSTLEILSELRMLAIAEKRGLDSKVTGEEAFQFLSEVLIASFELLFDDFTDASWEHYDAGELQKIRSLFGFLRERMPMPSLKPLLHREIEALIAHRPVMTTKLEKMLQVVDKNMELEAEDEIDRQLTGYVDAFFRPTALATQYPSTEAYAEHLAGLSRQRLKQESSEMGEQCARTGLVSLHQVALLRFLCQKQPAFISVLLHLNSHGRAEFEQHQSFIIMLIQEFITPATHRAVYGLTGVLQLNLFSRPIIWNAFNRLLRMEIHPKIAEDLQRGKHSGFEATPMQLLVGGLLSVLGHPLGVRQGNNPTCQSARGISMWSRHAPGKLINLIIDAAAANRLAFRYEGEMIDSSQAGEGLVRQFDYKLDPVSIVLVPLLDKVYNAMMRRAAVKHRGSDPHVSVNPAFYGHWIQTGFISVYNPMTGAIDDYERFLRIFYASFHPEYNGGHHLIYPVPLGIFQTNTRGEMTGYHAVSLLRIERGPVGNWRVYFLNPNSEGQQNWGQEIRPSVTGYGEQAGESSLPVHEFASRVYAFHYNEIHLGDKPEAVRLGEIEPAEKLARASWGVKYLWLN